MFRKSKPDYEKKPFDISYLTEDDINDNSTKTLDKLKNISRYLGSEDVLTY